MNKIFTLGLIILNSLCTTNAISQDETENLDNIKNEAAKFITNFNATTRSNWIVIGPSLKNVVVKCAVPLTVQWVPASYGRSAPSLSVSCTNALYSEKYKDWKVFVIVDKPR